MKFFSGSVLLLFISFFFIVGCSTTDNDRNEVINQQLTELKQENEQLKAESDDLNKKIKESQQEQNKSDIDYGIISLLGGHDLPIKIISETVEGKPSFVVFFEDFSMESDIIRKLQIIRITNQIVRDYKDVKVITIWEDEKLAFQYAEGDYDKEASPVGWEGLDHAIGRVYINENGVQVGYALSRDDIEMISFGMSNEF